MSWKKALLISLLVVTISLPLIILVAFFLAFKNRVYPRTSVIGINISGLTIDQATKVIERKITSAQPLQLKLKHNQQSWLIDLKKIDGYYLPRKTAEKAYRLSRRKPIENWLHPKEISLEFFLNEEKLNQELATIAAQIAQPAIPVRLIFNPETKTITVSEGKVGQQLDQDSLKTTIFDRLAFLKLDQEIELPIKTLNHLPNKEQIEAAQQRAEKLIGKKITFTSEQQNFVIDPPQLINFVGFTSWWDKEKIAEYVTVLAQSVNREPENALFRFENGRVTAFRPDRPGFRLNQEATVQLIIQGLNQLVNQQQSVVVKNLPLKKIEAQIKTSATNRLGIVALLGQGESYFRHSIASRVHNIDLASSRLHGLLIAPGETFSFNQALGEISKNTGFRDAYIIKNGRTILGTGGGVCQVSTTLFRAALNAGLPIIERRAHAYRVSYYEQNAKPGFDATVFSPTTDFKFKNDTQHYLLIQRVFNQQQSYLAFQLYGSPDGRQVTINNIRLWDLVPPPQPLYIDDPTLPQGVTKQIDWPAWGAKASFDWQVARDGQILHQKTFFSHYRPWRAIFLRGTKIN